MTPRSRLLFAAICPIALAPFAHAQPANNACASATPALAGSITVGNAQDATNDGSCSCSTFSVGDVYHTFTTTQAGVYSFSMCAATSWDTVISIHTGCPADQITEVDCDDDGCIPLSFGVPSLLRTYLAASTMYIVRITGYDSTAALGPYGLSIAAPAAHTGACCFAGQCSLQTSSGCALVGGTYKGDFTACAQPAGAPTTYVGAGTPATIPDNTPAGVSRTITVPTSYAVADVRLTINLAHPYMGDLSIKLSHGATTLTVLQRPGPAPFGFGLDLSGAYVFTDAATQSAWDAAALQPASSTALPPAAYLCSDGSAQVQSLRQTFAGQNASGVWTLVIADVSPPDPGTLNSWSLAIDASLGDPCAAGQGACCSGASQGGLGTTCIQTTMAGGTGSFRGAGVACMTGPDNFTACCKANVDGVNGIAIDDIFIFLNAWFAGCTGQTAAPCNGINANFDGVNGIAIDDIFIFLNAWFAGCR